MIETGWHVITFSHFNPPRTRTTTTSVRETRVGAPLKVGLWSLQQLGGIQYVHWLCTTLFWNCGCPDCRFILCNSCLYVLYFISSVYLNGFCISWYPFYWVFCCFWRWFGRHRNAGTCETGWVVAEYPGSGTNKKTVGTRNSQFQKTNSFASTKASR